MAGTSDTSNDNLTFEQMDTLFKSGALGTKELRNWLGNRYPEFAKVRDEDVDKGIEQIAQLRQKRMEAEAMMGEG